MSIDVNKNIVYLYFSSIANKHVLKAMSRLGAGSFEYFDSHAKSKWESKVRCDMFKDRCIFIFLKFMEISYNKQRTPLLYIFVSTCFCNFILYCCFCKISFYFMIAYICYGKFYVSLLFFSVQIGGSVW